MGAITSIKGPLFYQGGLISHYSVSRDITVFRQITVLNLELYHLFICQLISAVLLV